MVDIKCEERIYENFTISDVGHFDCTEQKGFREETVRSYIRELDPIKNRSSFVVIKIKIVSSIKYQLVFTLE